MAIHSPRKLTYEDFVRIPDDGQRHEILDGAHVVSPAPATDHQRVARRLCTRLDLFCEETGCGEVFPAPFDVVMSKHDIVEPDLLFVSNERKAIVGEAYVQGSPDLVIEVLSPSTRRRDLGRKRARYEALGVQEYWTLDPKATTAQVLRRQGDRFLPPLVLAAANDDRLTTPLLPGLVISLREIFGR